MEEKQEKSFLQSIYGKVIAAFFIGIVAVALAGLVSKVGFREMLQTVENLSAPNDKLRIVNSLFYQVTQLEQLQHVNAIENTAETADDFEPELRRVTASIDSLRDLCRQDQVQLARLDTMAQLMKDRQEMSETYFSLRNDLEQNQLLSNRINDLSALLAKMQPKENKKVVTTQKKYITTTLVDPEERKKAIAAEKAAEKAAAKAAKEESASGEKTSFIGRLFGAGKKNETPTEVTKPEKTARIEKLKKGTTEVKEEVHVKVDTYSVTKHSKSLAEVEKELRQIEKDYHERNSALLTQELALVKASHKLNRQLLDILKTFEEEELNEARGDYSKATMVVQASVSRMNFITVIFSLGAAIFAFLILLDISRGNKYRKLLLRAKEEAEHLSQVKQRFLANMSHELRTPLQSILGFAEQVRGQEKPKPESLDAIYNSAEHLLQIVNEVLDYSRIVSGKFTFVEQPFEVGQLAREVVATLQPQVSKKNLKLNLNISCEAAPYVAGDPFRLRQVLYNLLGNAIKFTEKGAVALTISCKAEGEKALVTFRVKDSGIGIPEEDISRIFNQFEQVEGVDMQKYGGTGLGLSIVKSLVEGQGGSLKVSSKLNEGSEFEFTLPFLIQEKPAQQVQTVAETGKPSFNGQVLVVDDDAIILKLCGAILDKHKIRNICLNSSLEAAAADWTEDLKIVFTDIQMPGMSGVQLCKRLREKLGSSVKIYALTAQALPEEHKELLTQGFDGIMMKPFREQALVETIQKHAAPETAPKKKVTDIAVGFGAISLIAGDNEQLAQAMLNLFVTETRPDLELLAIYLSDDLPVQAKEICHKLSGRLAQLGAEDLADKLRDFELELKDLKTVTPVKAGLKQVIAEMEKLVELAEKRAAEVQVV